MTTKRAKTLSEPVFKKCVRCGYSLRGLPASHACPECGLGFDGQCALYAAPKPPRWYALSFPLFVGAVWVALDYLRHFPPIAQASLEQFLAAMVLSIGLLCCPYFTWVLIKVVRGGLKIAVMTDGLLVNLPGYRNELFLWTNIAGASSGANTISVRLKKERRIVALGGEYKPFRTPADAQRCAAQINERLLFARQDSANARSVAKSSSNKATSSSGFRSS